MDDLTRTQLRNSHGEAKNLIPKLGGLLRRLKAISMLLMMRRDNASAQIMQTVANFREVLTDFQEENLASIKNIFQEKTTYLKMYEDIVKEDISNLETLCRDAESLLKHDTDTSHTQQHQASCIRTAFSLLLNSSSVDMELDDDIDCLEFVPCLQPNKLSTIGKVISSYNDQTYDDEHLDFNADVSHHSHENGDVALDNKISPIEASSIRGDNPRYDVPCKQTEWKDEKYANSEVCGTDRKPYTESNKNIQYNGILKSNKGDKLECRDTGTQTEVKVQELQYIRRSKLCQTDVIGPGFLLNYNKPSQMRNLLKTSRYLHSQMNSAGLLGTNPESYTEVTQQDVVDERKSYCARNQAISEPKPAFSPTMSPSSKKTQNSPRRRMGSDKSPQRRNTKMKENNHEVPLTNKPPLNLERKFKLTGKRLRNLGQPDNSLEEIWDSSDEEFLTTAVGQLRDEVTEFQAPSFASVVKTTIAEDEKPNTDVKVKDIMKESKEKHCVKTMDDANKNCEHELEEKILAIASWRNLPVKEDKKTQSQLEPPASQPVQDSLPMSEKISKEEMTAPEVLDKPCMEKTSKQVMSPGFRPSPPNFKMSRAIEVAKGFLNRFSEQSSRSGSFSSSENFPIGGSTASEKTLPRYPSSAFGNQLVKAISDISQQRADKSLSRMDITPQPVATKNSSSYRSYSSQNQTYKNQLIEETSSTETDERRSGSSPSKQPRLDIKSVDESEKSAVSKNSYATDSVEVPVTNTKKSSVAKSLYVTDSAEVPVTNTKNLLPEPTTNTHSSQQSVPQVISNTDLSQQKPAMNLTTDSHQPIPVMVSNRCLSQQTMTSTSYSQSMPVTIPEAGIKQEPQLVTSVNPKDSTCSGPRPPISISNDTKGEPMKKEPPLYADQIQTPKGRLDNTLNQPDSTSDNKSPLLKSPAYLKYIKTAYRYSEGVPAKFLLKFGDHGRSLKDEFHFPIGVATSPTGDIVVTDTGNHVIKVFDRDGHFKFTFGEDLRPGLVRPSAVVVTRNGDIFVKDDKCIHKFAQNGRFICRLGAKKFYMPYGLALTSTEELVTLDICEGDCRVFIIATDGSYGNCYRYEPLMNGTYGSKCRFLAVINDLLYVSDLGRDCMYITDLYGHFLQVIGHRGRKPGDFSQPAGITQDMHGHIIVADSRNERVQIFLPDGQFMSIVNFDEAITRPSDIHFTKDGRLIVVNYTSHVVKVYKLGTA